MIIKVVLYAPFWFEKSPGEWSSRRENVEEEMDKIGAEEEEEQEIEEEKSEAEE